MRNKEYQQNKQIELGKGMNENHNPQLSINLREHVQYYCDRQIVTLFKECLAMFEQLAEEHDEAMEKLHTALPDQYKPYVDLADHYTEEKGDRIRRAVLQRGNDCKRAVREELDKYTLTLGRDSTNNE